MTELDQALPSWLAVMDHEDMQFLQRFLLTAGSLKDLAAEYGVAYRTVRARLDRVIEKARSAAEAHTDDPFERKLRTLVASGEVTPAAARAVRAEYLQALKRRDDS
jgi:hypothetical protein